MQLPGFDGRLGRLAFLGQSIAFSIGLGIATFAMTLFLAVGGATSPRASMLFLVILLAPIALYGSLSLQVRRLHDIGWPAPLFIAAWFGIAILDLFMAHLVPALARPRGGTAVGSMIQLGFALVLLLWPGRQEDDGTPPAFHRPDLPPPATRQRALPGGDPRSRSRASTTPAGFGRRLG